MYKKLKYIQFGGCLSSLSRLDIFLLLISVKLYLHVLVLVSKGIAKIFDGGYAKTQPCVV